MTGRDRIVVIAIGVIVILGAAWLLVVSPERKQAATLSAQVSAASAQLATAEGQVANARSAQTQYAAAYASVVRLGKAVPPSQEVPALVYQIAHASNQRNVEFASITATTTSGSSSGATPAAATSAASTPAAKSAATSSAGFTQMPFTFVFNGTFSDLYHLFQQLDRATVHTTSGGLVVSGRLLTIQAIKLAPSTNASATTAGKGGSEQLSGNVTATAYVLPASQGLTGGATSNAPSQSATPAATPASTPSTPTSPTAPAIARVTP
jgi:Type II secretion system (T2SS), protein M